MKLGELLKGIEVSDFRGSPDLEIKGIAYDSRRIKPGVLFVALRGRRENGHDYIADAFRAGAAAVVAEEKGVHGGNPPEIVVQDSRRALSELAAAFYERPQEAMNLIGITGTNGKTTTSYLLESVLYAAGAKPGVIGTINYRFSGKSHPAPVTTPESLDLMGLLREMADAGTTDVIMEVSSHALDQKRTEACPFRVAVFTNLSRDHLDYHKTMETYFKAKSLLFSGLGKGKGDAAASAVINMDDPRGGELAKMSKAVVTTYGLGADCEVRAASLSADLKGLSANIETPVGVSRITSPLLGEVNIYNILASAAAALALDIPLETVVEGIARLKKVPGRLEVVENRKGLKIIVDYAHTPDALLKAIRALRPLVQGRFITVFGCGGDRDKGKRAHMGRIAGESSDLVLITSDNPRSEEPISIMKQIEKGVRESGAKIMKHPMAESHRSSGYLMEVDRRKAIRLGVSMARENDLVLIAGKGHEDYQIVGQERRHFDDREEAAVAASGGHE